MPLFSFSFWEILPIQAPLVQASTWLLTQLSLALSQESCSSPCTRAGASAALLPAQVPGILLSLSTLLTVRSFNVLYIWSLIFIYAGIPLAVRSAPQEADFYSQCPTITTLHFHHPKQKSCIYEAIIPHFLLPHPLVTSFPLRIFILTL